MKQTEAGVRDVSPAAAAAVSRTLQTAGVLKHVETKWGWTEGYVAEPRGDHVRVEWEPGSFAPESTAGERMKAGLALCHTALIERYPSVVHATAKLPVPGAWEEGPVIEVRNPKWTTRDHGNTTKEGTTDGP